MRLVAHWILPFLATSGVAFAGPLPLVAIQPLGPVKPEYIAKVTAGITAIYAVNVEVLPGKPLPASAWHAPRRRHKAEEIVDVLSAGLPERFSKIVGLTGGDISGTTDEGEDWGIMGLGQLGGKACVVSTFRLRSGNAGEARFLARLVKVVNHELGHTFGVDHCPVANCLMQDKRGKVASVDRENGKPCPVCGARLPLRK